jgi:hypothetical protein
LYDTKLHQRNEQQDAEAAEQEDPFARTLQQEAHNACNKAAG